jgi:hypothetical protein
VNGGAYTAQILLSLFLFIGGSMPQEKIKGYVRPENLSKEYWGWWDENYQAWVFERPVYDPVTNKLIRKDYIKIWGPLD